MRFEIVARHAAQHVVRDLGPVGGHSVDAGYRADGHDVVVSPLIAHDADRADRQQYGKELPDFAVQARAADLLIDDRFRPAENRQPFLRHGAEHPDREPGAGERLPPDDLIRQTQLGAQHPHLVLEQFPERLDQFQFHPGRQPADIMMRLDRGRRALEADALDHIGIERALRKKIRAANFPRLLLEHIDKGGADDLALLFRIADARKARKKKILRLAVHQMNIVVIAEQAHHLLRLAFAHQAGIDEDAGQLRADRLMQQHRHHGTVNAARKAADHPLDADIRHNLFSVIKESGYQVVVNLALSDSPNALPNEQAVVESLGMQYVHIPVVWEHPTLEDISRFFTVMEANADKPVFVHCAANMRVSAFMYLYRLIREQISNEQAMQNLHQIWIPNENWQNFIQQAIEHYQKQ